jgi:hypothetical protein
MTEPLFVFTILISVIVGGAIVFFLLKRKEGKPSDSLLMMQQQLSNFQNLIKLLNSSSLKALKLLGM